FDLFAKVSVKGKDQCPLYRWLTHHPDPSIAGEVVWNFQKYLLDRSGKVVAKFHPRVSPESEEVVSAVEKALSAGPD
ncbi:MAG: glutathione peroxidase, partial [Planctomycetota bacterium]